MDTHDVCDIQFLDLSDVEAHERARVLASLQRHPPGHNHEFPWFIGKERTPHKGKKLTNNPKYINEINTNQPNVATTPIAQPPHEHSQNSPSNMHYPPPTNNIPSHSFINIAPSPLFNHSPHVQSPVFAGNFQHMHSPNHTPMQPIRNIPGTPFFFATTASVVNPVYVVNPMYQNVGQHYAPPFVNGIDQMKVNVSSPPMPFANAKPYEVPQVTSEQKNYINTAEQPWPNYQLDNFTKDGNANIPNNFISQTADQTYQPTQEFHMEVQKEPAIQQNNNNTDNVQQENEIPITNNVPAASEIISNNTSSQQNLESKLPWGGGKSWASLFNSPSNSGNQTGNEAANIVNDKAVNDKSTDEQLCPIKHPKRAQFVDPECYRLGEFLIGYVMDGRAVSLQPRGLINQSNYCYINSILQALIACPPVYNLLNKLGQNVTSNEKRKPTPVIDGMCKFVKEFKHLPANMRVKRSEVKTQTKKEQEVIINTDIPFEPSWIYRMLNGMQTDLMEGRQEDAEEFLGLLLNSLNDEMLELMKLVKNEEMPEKTVNNNEENEEEDKEWQVMGPKNKGSITRRTEFEKTPISDIFGGFLKSRIHRTGDHVTENIQPFFTLQLNIERVKTVKEALENLTIRNQLEGLTSSKTNEEVEAWQQVMLDELPVILVLHLKCFDFKLDGCTKIVKALEFPIDLKIDTKLLSSKTAAPRDRQQYKLLAVVYHDGKEATKGHYVTDAFHVGYNGWLRYDDAAVRPVREEDVLRPQGARVPYLLFYRRADTIRGK